MDRRWWATLKQKIGEPVIPHLVYTPADYDKDTTGKRWPVLLFLHGKGERGENLSQLRDTPLLAKLEYDPAFRKTFPFIVIAPQCRENDWWSSHELARLLDEVEQQYRVDTDREYVTGMSMGGYGTWALANEFPDRFAAIAPVCGGGDPDEAARLARMPVWTFHGARDSIVPFWESDRMVKALQALGDEVKFTVYPDAGHDAWSETYTNPELYTWLLSHTRSGNQRRASTAGSLNKPFAAVRDEQPQQEASTR
jgi:predicted peptidase